MVSYSELEKRIALLLMHGPKTFEELVKQLNVSSNECSNALKKMLQLKVVEKQGFPTKYALKKDISKEVSRRQEIESKDENKVRLKIIIEGKALNENSLNKMLSQIIEALKKDSDFLLYDFKQETPLKEGEYYSNFIEVNLSLKDFSAITKLVFFYAPTSIEVVKPAKIELTAQDLQDSLITMTDMVHAYSQYILKQMNKEELNAFNKKVYNKL